MDTEGSVSILRTAVVAGNSFVVEALLKGGETCDVACNKTLLHDAAALGHCDIIRLLVKAGWSLETINSLSETPLLSALRCRQHWVAEILVYLGANCNVTTRGWKTPLEIAIDRDECGLVEKLVSNGAIVHNHDVLQAFELGRVRIMATLLNINNSIINEADSEGYSLLTRSVMKNNKEFVKMLLGQKCSVDVIDKNKWTALHHAVYLNYIEIARMLINHGANIALLTLRKHTTMYLATQNGSLDMIKLLMEKGASLEIKSNRRRREMFNIAMQHNNEDLIDLFLEEYPNEMDSVDDDGNTPLLLAAAAGRHRAVKGLLSRGADRRSRDTCGRDALYMAVLGGHTSTIQVLIGHLAKTRPYNRITHVSQQTKLFPNVLFLAIEFIVRPITNDSVQSCKTMELLLKSASPEELQEKNVHNQTLLHVAVFENCLDLIILIKKYYLNIDLHAIDSFDKTPLSIAVKQSNYEMIILLLSDENHQTVDSILMREIKNRNLNCIEALVDSKIDTTFENTVLGILCRSNIMYYKIASKYGIKTSKYIVLRRLIDEGNFKFDQWSTYRGKLANFFGILNAGADFNHVNNDGNGALHLASLGRNPDFVSQLLNQGEDPRQLNNNGQTPLIVASGASGINTEVINVLVTAAPDVVRNTDNYGRNALLHSARFGLIENYDALLSVGSNLNHVDKLGNGSLHLAAIGRNLHIVTQLLKRGIDPRQLNSNNETPLIMASGTSDINTEIIKVLMAAAPDVVSNKDNYGRNALLHSARFGHIENFNALLTAGCDLNYVDKQGNGALHLASLGGNLEIVSQILKRGSDPRQRNIKGQTPLILASGAFNINIEVINVLIAAAPDVVSKTDNNGKTALLHSCQFGHVENFTTLLSVGSDLNHVDKQGNGALHLAGLGRNLEIVSHILKLGIDPRQRNIKGQTPLIVASGVSDTNTEVIHMLIAVAPDILSNTDNYGKTALLHSAQFGHVENFNVMHIAGSDLKHVDKRGNGVLHMAGFGRKLNIVSQLLKLGVDPRQLNNKGQTPLIVASGVSDVNIEVINVLIAAAPDIVSQTDNYGKTALLYSAQFGHVENCNVLHSAGSDLKHVDKDGDGALHLAAIGRKLNIVSHLLKLGVDSRQLNNNNQTPLIMASRVSDVNTEVINVLLATATDILTHADSVGQTALLHSAWYGHVDNFIVLHSAGSDLKHVDNDGNGALHLAALGRKLNIVSHLLQLGVDPRQLNNKGQTPLIVASGVSDVNTEVINVLIASAPDVLTNADNVGQTALLHSAQFGHVDNFNALHSAGSDLKHIDKDGDGALHLAAFGRKLNIVSHLLKLGVDPRQLNNKGQTPLVVASGVSEVNTEVINVLIASAPDVLTNADSVGQTALLRSAQFGHVDNFIALHSAGSDLKHIDKDGDGALHLAAFGRKLNIVSHLLKLGVDPRQLNNKGQTPLVVASGVSEVNTEVINVLIASAPDVLTNADSVGQTALLRSAQFGHVDNFIALHSAGSDLQHVDKNGDGALHLAAFGRKLNIASHLLQLGVDPRQLNNNGQTPLVVASGVSDVNTEVINVLIASAPDVLTNADNVGQTALLHSAQFGHVDNFIALHSAGSDLQHVDKNGDGALHLAVFGRKLNIVSHLLKLGVDPRQLNNKGQTPLIVASGVSDVNKEVINVFIAAAPDIVSQTHNYGKTALLYSGQFGHVDNFIVLHSVGSDFKHVDKDGNIALDLAAIRRKINIFHKYYDIDNSLK